MNNTFLISEVTEILFGNSKDRPGDGLDGEFYLGKRETSLRKRDHWRRLNGSVDLSTSTRVRVGDVVIPLSGDLEQPFLVREEHVGSVLGKDCALLRPIKGKGVLSEWILAWARSSAFKAQVLKLETGAAVKYIPVKAAATLKIFIPELQAQNRMAMLINTSDQAIADLEDLNDELKLLQQLKVDIAFIDES